MSLTQYNSLMSSMLNQKHVLAKLRAELERRWRKIYFECKKFGYLAHNCRNRKGGEKRTLIPQNRFEVLSSRVMRYEVEIRRQKSERKEEEIIQCFKCKEKRH